MRKIILNLAVSLDGFIEGPNGEIDWLTFTEETGIVLNNFIKDIDTVLYGRITYDSWGTYKPSQESSDFEKNFYSEMDKKLKYVFSKSKSIFEGNPIVINSDIEKQINNIKKEQGKNIWLYGGANLITSLLNLNLIDEFRLAICPIILGEGKPLFKNIKDRKKLKLISAKGHESGIVELIYNYNH
ncbi:dihydrofolate reductase family protein [Flavivirga sp. 57AJ16]|uniref:dihydrofolate reductase family protein n=1 Tax=Flavivirga sp. 57AJ16 TaxID=3025307 RepID=UPI002366487D|nr:dihydrofolate reductase family protein [Flavivirga sp. 57AJ16]MDD7886938.1 dihydrofolate reductase family protein [Flavivirga sp. 57AJ16]